jgi:hypothetical protein
MTAAKKLSGPHSLATDAKTAAKEEMMLARAGKAGRMIQLQGPN